MNRFRPLLVLAGVVLGVASFTVAVPGSEGVAGAAGSLSFTVNTTTDAHDATPGNGICADSAGQCTLRVAIEESNAQPAGSTVTVAVPAGKYKLTLGALAITHNSITITGAGPKATVVQGKGAAVATVAAKAQGTLADLELTKGAAGTKHGGGGLSNSGAATLSNVVVTANTAGSGAGIANAAGGTLRLTSSTVSANFATERGRQPAGGFGRRDPQRGDPGSHCQQGERQLCGGRRPGSQ